MSIHQVVLVGGSGTGKTKFFTYCTGNVKETVFPTTETKGALTDLITRLVIIDTPGIPAYRNGYSWNGIFSKTDLIVNFGGWTPSEIGGEPPQTFPTCLTWSGDHAETMDRILYVLNK